MACNSGKSTMYVIWQRNCRGFRRKRGNVQQFLPTKDSEPPDITALQETGGQAKLLGYASFCTDVSGTGKAPIATRNSQQLMVPRSDWGSAGVLDDGCRWLEHFFVEEDLMEVTTAEVMEHRSNALIPLQPI
ncbi:hypothetical protein HPB49_015838 [Dermacentor silvarum]|uniref:Uncharacterized protein n=1 Tax=Dermacentor silvarum TaxID=543639 RepID=A0ACB8D6H4_DERSI|nr:hypothetical protein HPB49_015838 [Dermacentor silvarum]